MENKLNSLSEFTMRLNSKISKISTEPTTTYIDEYPSQLNNKARIPSFNVNLFISMSLINYTDETIYLDMPEGNNGLQIWINYYDKNGNALTIPDSISTAFIPETIDFYSSFETMTSGDIKYLRFSIHDAFSNKPNEAVTWSMYIRPIIEESGTTNFSQFAFIDSITFNYSYIS
jgi:hypothetical protein